MANVDVIDAVQRTLESQGILQSIRAQLRANVLQILSSQSEPKKRPIAPYVEFLSANKIDNNVAVLVVMDFLKQLGLAQTLTVLEAESGFKFEPADRDLLCGELHMSSAQKVTALEFLIRSRKEIGAAPADSRERAEGRMGGKVEESEDGGGIGRSGDGFFKSSTRESGGVSSLSHSNSSSRVDHDQHRDHDYDAKASYSLDNLPLDSEVTIVARKNTNLSDGELISAVKDEFVNDAGAGAIGGGEENDNYDDDYLSVDESVPEEEVGGLAQGMGQRNRKGEGKEHDTDSFALEDSFKEPLALRAGKLERDEKSSPSLVFARQGDAFGSRIADGGGRESDDDDEYDFATSTHTSPRAAAAAPAFPGVVATQPGEAKDIQQREGREEKQMQEEKEKENKKEVDEEEEDSFYEDSADARRAAVTEPASSADSSRPQQVTRGNLATWGSNSGDLGCTAPFPSKDDAKERTVLLGGLGGLPPLKGSSSFLGALPSLSRPGSASSGNLGGSGDAEKADGDKGKGKGNDDDDAASSNDSEEVLEELDEEIEELEEDDDFESNHDKEKHLLSSTVTDGALLKENEARKTGDVVESSTNDIHDLLDMLGKDDSDSSSDEKGGGRERTVEGAKGKESIKDDKAVDVGSNSGKKGTADRVDSDSDEDDDALDEVLYGFSRRRGKDDAKIKKEKEIEAPAGEKDSQDEGKVEKLVGQGLKKIGSGLRSFSAVESNSSGGGDGGDGGDGDDDAPNAAAAKVRSLAVEGRKRLKEEEEEEKESTAAREDGGIALSNRRNRASVNRVSGSVSRSKSGWDVDSSADYHNGGGGSGGTEGGGGMEDFDSDGDGDVVEIARLATGRAGTGTLPAGSLGEDEDGVENFDLGAADDHIKSNKVDVHSHSGNDSDGDSDREGQKRGGTGGGASGGLTRTDSNRGRTAFMCSDKSGDSELKNEGKDCAPDEKLNLSGASGVQSEYESEFEDDFEADADEEEEEKGKEGDEDKEGVLARAQGVGGTIAVGLGSQGSVMQQQQGQQGLSIHSRKESGVDKDKNDGEKEEEEEEEEEEFSIAEEFEEDEDESLGSRGSKEASGNFSRGKQSNEKARRAFGEESDSSGEADSAFFRPSSASSAHSASFSSRQQQQQQEKHQEREKAEDKTESGNEKATTRTGRNVSDGERKRLGSESDGDHDHDNDDDSEEGGVRDSTATEVIAQRLREVNEKIGMMEMDHDLLPNERDNDDDSSDQGSKEGSINGWKANTGGAAPESRRGMMSLSRSRSSGGSEGTGPEQDDSDEDSDYDFRSEGKKSAPTKSGAAAAAGGGRLPAGGAALGRSVSFEDDRQLRQEGQQQQEGEEDVEFDDFDGDVLLQESSGGLERGRAGAPQSAAAASSSASAAGVLSRGLQRSDSGSSANHQKMPAVRRSNQEEEEEEDEGKEEDSVASEALEDMEMSVGEESESDGSF